MIKKVYAMLRIVLNRIKKPSVFMGKNPAYRAYEIGEGTYGFPIVHLGRTHGNLKIGKYCSIGPEVRLLLVNDHRRDWVTTYPFTVLFKEAENILGYPYLRGDIVIGNDVWIGYGATILSGVTVGNGAIIGANAMVAKNVPPYAIVAGNPAVIIKKRFDDKTINSLEEIAWWNWPLDKIKSSFPDLLQNNLDAFVEKYNV